jgi:hypothetical protein
MCRIASFLCWNQQQFFDFMRDEVTDWLGQWSFLNGGLSVLESGGDATVWLYGLGDGCTEAGCVTKRCDRFGRGIIFVQLNVGKW